jgi:hypothetical protein
MKGRKSSSCIPMMEAKAESPIEARRDDAILGLDDEEEDDSLESDALLDDLDFFSKFRCASLEALMRDLTRVERESRDFVSKPARDSS